MCFRPNECSLATSSKSKYFAPEICCCLYSSFALRGEFGMNHVQSSILAAGKAFTSVGVNKSDLRAVVP